MRKADYTRLIFEILGAIGMLIGWGILFFAVLSHG